MEFTPELLRQYAKTVAEKRTREDYSILAAYLIGSILTEQDPFLGGTTDIDLILIHIGDPEIPREILPLNKDIHYDILHHSQRKYLDRISLRTDPWMGPMLSEAIALYDPQHFMDLTQASVRGLFHQTENVIQRAHTLLQTARTGWFEFQPPPQTPGPSEILRYFGILDSAANAIALLTGEPLTERRFLINLEQRASRIGKQGFYPGFLGMLGAPEIDIDLLGELLSDWEKTFTSLPEKPTTPSLDSIRLNYYLKGFKSILESDQPVNVLWPLLHTWTLAVHTLSTSDPRNQQWQEVMHQLQLLGNGFAERILALDALLDQVEDAIKAWEFSEGT